MKKIRVIIVDDEPPARRRLRDLLKQEQDVEIVRECRNGREAITAVISEVPDLIFLDVQMPEVDGFAVVAALPEAYLPAIIFVTAYDEFALQAFEVHALDYLLKPFDQDRFQRSLMRARDRIALNRGGGEDAEIKALLYELKSRDRVYQERFAIKGSGRIHFIDVGDVEYVAAEGNYVRLVTKSGSHLIRESLTSLEERLNPSEFLRIHRSTIIRLQSVRQMEPLFQGEYSITLNSGAKVRSSRLYRAKLHAALELG